MPSGEAKDATLLNQKDEKSIPGAPEKYEDFKVPEGYELDKGVAEEAGKLFKGMGLNQAQAQELVNFYTKQTTEAAEQPFKAMIEMRQEWRKEITNDPQIGHKLPQVKADISKMVDSLEPKLAASFREAMDLTGAGDNPAFIRAFAKLAERFTEGKHVEGKGPSPLGQTAPGTSAKPSLASALYPNLS